MKDLIVMRNAQGFEVLPRAAEGIETPGVVHLANEARFDSTYYSEPLTQYTVGWRDPADLDGLLDHLAPSVAVPSKFEFKKGKNDEAFFSDLDDERAIGAEFKRIEYTGETALGKVHNRGLTVRLDRDEMVDGDEEKVVGNLLRMCKRNSIRRAVTIIDAASTNVNKTWLTDGNAADPDTDLEDSLELGADASGIRPNRGIFANGSWSLRRKSYRAQANAGGFTGASMSLADVQQDLMLSALRRSTERYVTKKDGTKAKFIAGNIVLFWYAEDGIMKDDPSNIKRFYRNTDAGGKYAVYVQPVGVKFIDITVEYYESIIATHTLGIRKVTAS